MPYLPNDQLRPEPSIDDAPFWEGCRARELRVQCCADCGRHRHPPTPRCPYCQSANLRWEAVRGPARLYTWTEVHHAAHPAVRGRGPYVVAVVEYPEMGGVRVISNLVDAAAPKIGAELALFWDDVGDGMWLPRYRGAGG